jgi:hypothetical protein
MHTALSLIAPFYVHCQENSGISVSLGDGQFFHVFYSYPSSDFAIFPVVLDDKAHISGKFLKANELLQ